MIYTALKLDTSLIISFRHHRSIRLYHISAGASVHETADLMTYGVLSSFFSFFSLRCYDLYMHILDNVINVCDTNFIKVTDKLTLARACYIYDKFRP